jgi:hypothetical protein
MKRSQSAILETNYPEGKRMRLNIRAFIPLVMLGLATLACIQDCELVSRSLSGIVLDDDGNPIAGAAVHIYSGNPGYYGGGNGTIAPDINLISDENGQFSTTDFGVFLCDELIIEIEADGFETHQSRYAGWAGTAAYNQSYGNLEIILERTP